jgi:ABC-type amino acid transport substrate-binding protein
MQREASAERVARTRRVTITAGAVALLATVTFAQRAPSGTGTLERIRESGRIRFGYRVDARPFSYQDTSGQAAGYSAGLCRKIADDLARELRRGALVVEWVAVSLDQRFPALARGDIDLLCAADTITLARRTEVGFSIPIFPGGIGALVRADAPARLKEVLTGKGQTLRPTWRASASNVLQARAFSAVAGTTAERWLTQRITDLEVIANEFPVPNYETGMQRVLDRKSDAFFGERAVLLDAARRSAAAKDLAVIDRLFTFEPLALAMARGNDGFRLLVDRTLARLYRSEEIGALYTQSFGEPDDAAVAFFRWHALPE